MESYDMIILNVAEESFAKNGFANTKLLELAKQANVNHALIHYYYRTKDKLYESVVERLFEKWEQQIKTFEWVGDDPTAVLTDYIERYFRFYVENVNFHKIRIWDVMEKKNLFAKYTEKFWKKDLEEKDRVFQMWKDKKMIRPQANGRLLLYSLWAQIQYFYSMDEENLQLIFNNKEGLDKNRKLLVERIAETVVQQVVI
ncbi:MAG: TetR/AcrR family transcriptional regulator [Lachnospiraceae bacterium]|nr:TetR/AcrR family transcriptional regulator [Lachnospiraceae bacterium]